MPVKSPPQMPIGCPPQIVGTLTKIHQLSHQVNCSVDQATAVVAGVEEFLQGCNVGNVEAKVAVGKPNDSISLLYIRFGERFRIAVEYTEQDEGPPVEKTKPFSECSRDLKLKAYQNLPELIDQIATKLEVLIASATATTQTVNKLGVSPKAKQ